MPAKRVRKNNMRMDGSESVDKRPDATKMVPYMVTMDDTTRVAGQRGEVGTVMCFHLCSWAQT
jgi:hypothetical protein